MYPCVNSVHKTIHSIKIKSSGEHEILNLRDIGDEDAAQSIRKVDLQNMLYTIHKGQKSCAFCADCDQPVWIV